MPDYFSDDLIKILYEIGAEEVEKKKQIRRMERAKQYPQKPIDKVTTFEFANIIKAEIDNEITTSRKVIWLLDDIDEEINWIIQKLGIKDVQSILGKIYHKVDKSHEYPIFKTEFKKSNDSFGECYYEKPVLIACIPTKITIGEWRIYIINLIYGYWATVISENIKQNKKELENLYEQEEILKFNWIKEGEMLNE